MRLLAFFAITAAAVAADAPSLTKDVQPIFEANCAGCHATNVKMGSLDLDSYASILKGGNHGDIVVPNLAAMFDFFAKQARKPKSE